MSTRRSILRGLVAAPFASVPALAAGQPATTDPVFALIHAHRAAWDHFGAVSGEFSGKLADEPPDFVAKREAADNAETEALEALLTIEPTTLAGLRAFAEYMLAYDIRVDGEIYRDERTRWALETIAEACSSLIPIGGVS